MTYYLAIDIGASNGRHILSHIENERLVLEEIYRFDNNLTQSKDGLVWDTDSLFSEVLNGIKKCKEIGKIPKSIAIDTWGVDYVLLDETKKKSSLAIATVTAEQTMLLTRLKTLSPLLRYTRKQVFKSRISTRFISFMQIRKTADFNMQNTF